MRIWGLIALCAAPVAHAENLLANPGFEELGADGRPRQWDVFLMPMDGAYARIERAGVDESFAVVLHNPQPYPEDPVNNWSQVVLADVAGKTIRVSGDLRTAGATEAAIWLQCWSRSRRGVIAAESTSREWPTYGDRDWSRVEMTVEVPLGTDFLVLRCVLLGEGTAWFDNLSVDDDVATEAESRDLTALEPPDPSAPASGDEDAAIQEANEALLETVNVLSAQILRLQTEIEALRRQVVALTGVRSVAAPRRPFLLEPLEAPSTSGAGANLGPWLGGPS